MNEFYNELTNIETINEDEIIARKILNMCANQIIDESVIDLITIAKAKHFCLAYKYLKSSVIKDMALFEYLKDNILNIELFEDEDDIYV